MEGEPRPVEDFGEVFAAFRDSQEPILLVGGHAVNVWALNYYNRVQAEFSPHEPLTSSDMDIYATRNALLWLNSELGGKLYTSGPREIVLGAIELQVGGHLLMIEALRTVNGVTDEELQSRASLYVSSSEILVPLPHVLMKAKLANAMELSQRDRQDVKHVRLLAIVLREHLIDLANMASVGNERDLLRIVRSSVDVLKSDNAKLFEDEYGICFDDYLPLEDFENSKGKLAAFAISEFRRRHGE